MFICSLMTQCLYFESVRREHTSIFFFKVTQKLNLKYISKTIGSKKKQPLRLYLKISQVGYLMVIASSGFSLVSIF